eukprot:CAMPEP_0117617344 /NCGR_PEP_ID=MMETSP0784-20121206/85545_1 /TAXON_ID=39447 /ORGANISM="" /LENGTH=237 /DNA_ID=CAMNT_0005421185 /DNA_START=121 /DNA_END=830 /DNA_ORIENTATION=-
MCSVPLIVALMSCGCSDADHRPSQRLQAQHQRDLAPAPGPTAEPTRVQAQERTMQPTERRYVVSVMYNRCDPGVFATKAMLSLHRVHAEYIIYAGNLPAGCEDLKITVWKIPAEMFNITNSRGKHKMRHTVKLVLFQLPGLEPGSRVVTLDTDAVPAQNIDEMFDFITEESPFWAASDPLPTFQMNSGVMLYMKSEGLFKRVMNTFETYGSAFGRDDQDLISFHFQVVENLHSFLPG